MFSQSQVLLASKKKPKNNNNKKLSISENLDCSSFYCLTEQVNVSVYKWDYKIRRFFLKADLPYGVHPTSISKLKTQSFLFIAFFSTSWITPV